MSPIPTAPPPPGGPARPTGSVPAAPGEANIPTPALTPPQTPVVAPEASRLVPAAPAPPVEEVVSGIVVEMLWMPPRRSETIGKLAGALAKAQGSFTGATKDSKNPHFRSAYASLGAILNAVREPLSANGLAILQPVTGAGKSVVITTMLLHESGEWIEQPFMLTGAQSAPQAMGSLVTYARRYGLGALLVVATEDDDGEAATRTLPGAVVQDSRTTPLQTVRETAQNTLAPVVEPTPSVGAVPALPTSAVPPPPGRPPLKAPGSK
jgi:ERF superfamily